MPGRQAVIAPLVSKPGDREHSYHVSAVLESPAASETGLVSLPAATSSRLDRMYLFAQPGRSRGAGQRVIDAHALGWDAKVGRTVASGGEILRVGGDARVADQQAQTPAKGVPYAARSRGI
jgi:hypothetical protein